MKTRIPRLVPVLVVVVSASCVGDRAPSHATGPGTREDASEPAEPPTSFVDAGETPIASRSVLDAGADAAGIQDVGTLPKADAQAADAGKAQAPSPLVLKGARKCTDEEAADEVCSEGKRPGFCLEGFCVVETNCPRYCAAIAAREHADCVPGFDVKECQGVRECLAVRKETLAMCTKLRADIERGCLQATCANIRMLPPPPS